MINIWRTKIQRKWNVAIESRRPCSTFQDVFQFDREKITISSPPLRQSSDRARFKNCASFLRDTLKPGNFTRTGYKRRRFESHVDVSIVVVTDGVVFTVAWASSAVSNRLTTGWINLRAVLKQYYTHENSLVRVYIVM